MMKIKDIENQLKMREHTIKNLAQEVNDNQDTNDFWPSITKLKIAIDEYNTYLEREAIDG